MCDGHRLKNSPARRAWVSEAAPAKTWQPLSWPGSFLLPSEGRGAVETQSKEGVSFLTPKKLHGPSKVHLVIPFRPHSPVDDTLRIVPVCRGLAFLWWVQRSPSQPPAPGPPPPACFLSHDNSGGIRTTPAPMQGPTRARVSGELGSVFKQPVLVSCKHKTHIGSFRLESPALCSQRPGLPHSPAWLWTKATHGPRWLPGQSVPTGPRSPHRWEGSQHSALSTFPSRQSPLLHRTSKAVLSQVIKGF